VHWAAIRIPPRRGVTTAALLEALPENRNVTLHGVTIADHARTKTFFSSKGEKITS